MAEQWLAGVEADLMRGSWAVPNPSSESVAVWAERWMASKLNLKPKTRADYDVRLRAYVLPRWGDTPISKITRGDIQSWVQQLVSDGANPSTVHHAVGVLSRILNEAVIAGALAANPCQRISMPRELKRDIKPLTIEQVRVLAYEIENPPEKPAGNGAAPTGRHHFPEYGLLVRLAAFSGLRAAEIAGLKVNAVDLDNGVLRVTETLSEVRGKLYTVPPKTYQARAVPLPNFLVKELRTHIAQLGAGKEYVFHSSSGEPLSWHNFYRRHFKPAVLRAGLPKETRFHDLRHTAAAFMIAANAHPRAIMERLGHSSITVTLGTYGHLLPSLDEELTRKLDAQWIG
jgi:integrase